MLQPLKHILKAKQVILASTSPRRKAILEEQLGLDIRIESSSFVEDLDKSSFASPADYAMENSLHKATIVAKTIENEDWLLVVGADTVVVHGNRIFEKPNSSAEAIAMLKTLSGAAHQVITGVTMVKKQSGSMTRRTFYESTEVVMPELDDAVISTYVESGEPMDKAGSYGIQGLGASLVSSINGDFFNVMGFPAHRFARELIKFINE